MKIKNQTATFAASVVPPVLLTGIGIALMQSGYWSAASVPLAMAGLWAVMGDHVLRIIASSTDKTLNTKVHLNREFDEDSEELEDLQ